MFERKSEQSKHDDPKDKPESGSRRRFLSAFTKTVGAGVMAWHGADKIFAAVPETEKHKTYEGGALVMKNRAQNKDVEYSAVFAGDIDGNGEWISDFSGNPDSVDNSAAEEVFITSIIKRNKVNVCIIIHTHPRYNHFGNFTKNALSITPPSHYVSLLEGDLIFAHSIFKRFGFNTEDKKTKLFFKVFDQRGVWTHGLDYTKLEFVMEHYRLVETFEDLWTEIGRNKQRADLFDKYYEQFEEDEAVKKFAEGLFGKQNIGLKKLCGEYVAKHAQFYHKWGGLLDDYLTEFVLVTSESAKSTQIPDLTKLKQAFGKLGGWMEFEVYPKGGVPKMLPGQGLDFKVRMPK